LRRQISYDLTLQISNICVNTFPYITLNPLKYAMSTTSGRYQG
jgi:hypothetical protein